MEKLKITEMNRLSEEAFKAAEKIPLVMVLDNVRILLTVGAVFSTDDVVLLHCIYL